MFRNLSGSGLVNFPCHQNVFTISMVLQNETELGSQKTWILRKAIILQLKYKETNKKENLDSGRGSVILVD